MIPLKDNIQARRTPVVNYTLIAVTGVVFLLQLSSGERGLPGLIDEFGMVPQRIVDPARTVVINVQGRSYRLGDSAVPPWLTMLTCIFLHAGWLHILGNMWFLYIFGDNVEDRLGRVGYLLFYVAAGITASGVQLIAQPESPYPTVGASGAIAGVMGAYFILYPRATVLTLIPIFIIIEIIVIPAPFFLGIWFLMQFLSQRIESSAGATGGVAWWAHIGGFLAGFAVGLYCRFTGSLEKRRVIIRPLMRRRYGRRGRL